MSCLMPYAQGKGMVINMKSDLIQRILEQKIIAIVRGVYGEECIRLAQALRDGGIKIVEVTFEQGKPERLMQTADTLRLLADRFGSQMVFGAGTVTSIDMLELAEGAGARFVISPDINEEVIRRTVADGLVSIPGAMTPTEILTAHRCGADFVKVFPSSTLGATYIKAIRNPIPHVRLLAVGGVDENNISDFLEAGVSGVGVGGNLVNKIWIADGKFDKITGLARRIVGNLRRETSN